MSIISNQPELQDRPKGTVYLPKRMTEAEFVNWCDDETWAEWINGRVLLMALIDFQHASLTSFLIQLAGGFIEQDDLGVVLSAPFQIRFGRLRRRRSPDLIFISKNRLP